MDNNISEHTSTPNRDSKFMLAYFDCTNGIAGDMIVAALIDAGADWDQFQKRLAGLELSGYQTKIEQVTRCNIRAKHFRVIQTEKQHDHRNLSQIIEIINRSKLHDRVKERAKVTFRRLGEVEANVHNCEISEVHFHEVGAIDAIVDIVGTCICLELLNLDEIYYSKTFFACQVR